MDMNMIEKKITTVTEQIRKDEAEASRTLNHFSISFKKL